MTRYRALLLFWLLTAMTASARYETQWVEFPALKDFDGKPVALSALLLRPDGPGPFPAVVLLHGCGGMLTSQGNVTRSYRQWSELLATNGFVTLLVDSFTPRGQPRICEQLTRTILVNRERVEDAYAASQWLARRADVQADRIGLIGWSNGGSGTLFSLLPGNRRGQGFRAAVAFYPGCAALAKARAPYRPYAPLLVLIGEADDWTLAAPCVDLARIAQLQGAGIEIVTYRGAHHSFDRAGLAVRERPDVRNPNRPGGRGATVGEHPQAREDAVRRTLEFFARNLRD